MRQRDDEKAVRIKDAVIEIILEEGFSGASISKIARRAEVSPATVYIYYENKEEMLRSIFDEYSDCLWENVISGVFPMCRQPQYDGRQIVEQLIRNYYNFMMENETLFSFVKEFSSCPALSRDCAHSEEVGRIFQLFQMLKDRHVFKPYSDIVLFAIFFRPLQVLKDENLYQMETKEEMLQELIGMIQDMVLY